MVEQILAIVIQNFDKIGSALAFIFTLAYVVVRMGDTIAKVGERYDEQRERDDAFRNKLLELYAQGQEKLGKLTELQQQHNDDAEVREKSRSERDEKMVVSLGSIVKALEIVNSTSAEVQAVHSIAGNVQMNVSDILSKFDDLLTNIASYTQAVNVATSSITASIGQAIKETASSKDETHITHLKSIDDRFTALQTVSDTLQTLIQSEQATKSAIDELCQIIQNNLTPKPMEAIPDVSPT